jgi:hypothetical protein
MSIRTARSRRPHRSGSHRPLTRRLAVGAIAGAGALVLAACGDGADDPTLSAPEGAPATAATGGDMGTGGGTAEGMNADAPRVPPVFAYYDGEEVFFIHTEVSDEKIAQVLEGMMGSPVPVVPALAEVPDEALGTVYVFTNGVKPEDTPLGPLNFQPDVFDSAPGDPGYTPLRRIVEVTWSDDAQAEVLTSVDQIEQAESAGELTLKPTEVVVNTPFLTWPQGQR